MSDRVCEGHREQVVQGCGLTLSLLFFPSRCAGVNFKDNDDGDKMTMKSPNSSFPRAHASCLLLQRQHFLNFLIISGILALRFSCSSAGCESYSRVGS